MGERERTGRALGIFCDPCPTGGLLPSLPSMPLSLTFLGVSVIFEIFGLHNRALGGGRGVCQTSDPRSGPILGRGGGVVARPPLWIRMSSPLGACT